MAIQIEVLDENFELRRVGPNRLDLFIPLRIDIAVSKLCPPKVEDLTPRETEILYLKGYGMATRAIATKLCVSIKTIEAHLSNMRVKFGIQTTNGLIYVAFKKGLIPLEAEQ